MNNEHELVWWLVIIMAFCGLLSHWLKQLIVMRNNRTPGVGSIGFREYWFTCWPESLVALFSTVAAVVFFNEMGWLTHATAFFIGYASNSISESIGGRIQAMINAGK